MKRSKFNLSNTQLLSCDMGQLVPCGLIEVLPGDTVQHMASVLARCMPLATPPMHRVNLKVHHWFVPHRIIWEDWENFITGGPDGMDASVFPTIDVAAVAQGSLADYLGVPVGMTGAVSALPFRAYAKIYNEWYRDQDLITELGLSLASGDDNTTNTTLQNVCWEKDRFTTARPWEQKGPEVTLPLGTSAPVNLVPHTQSTAAMLLRDKTTGALTGAIAGIDTDAASALDQTGSGPNIVLDPNGRLVTDLSGASAIDINTVREAFALQRYQEARARYGSRYTEYLAYLGVRSSDARLQRPEYLGGGRQTISFSEVLQTASTTADVNGVGQLYGHGIAAMRSNRYRKFFEEHGYIISLVSILPETMYPQGIFRTWNRRVKEDFWQRELQHIGQEPVLVKELYALGATPDSVFGYQDRYDDYRYAESRVHGEFTTTLNDWHFARLLAAQPTLNASFVTADPAKRAFQSQATDTMLLNVRHIIGARRQVAARGSSFIF